MQSYTLHIQDEFLDEALQLLKRLPTHSFFIEPLATNSYLPANKKTVLPISSDDVITEQQRLLASQTLAELGKRAKVSDVITPVYAEWNALQ